MSLSLRYAAHSEIGLVRNNNQDSAYTSPTLIVVADGMGGAAAGDLASTVAVRELERIDTQNRPGSDGQETLTRLTGEAMLVTLGGALAKANDRLADLVVHDHSLEGMGTTVCGAMFSGEQYGICHIGDSRGYLVRDGEFRRITHDHSFVQSLVDDGKITEEEAAHHPHRSLLLKVLNGQPTHTPDFELLDAKAGDRIMFCSDGLCGMVDDDVIEPIMVSEASLEEIVERLTAAAHDGGGLDNITIVVADVVEADTALDAVAPAVLGAAETVEIPEVDAPRTIDLGDRHEDTHRINGDLVPSAPAPMARGGATALPEGVIDPDQFEAIRYRPHLPGRRRRLMPVLTSILAVLALLVAGWFGGRYFLGTQFFIGPSEEKVAVYQGVTDEVFGQPLNQVIEQTQILITDLPPYYAQQVLDRKFRYDSADEAHTQVLRLEELAEKCRAERAGGGSASPSSPASASPSETSGPQGTASPDPSASASDQSTSAPSSSSPRGPTSSSAPAGPSSGQAGQEDCG